MIAPRHPAPVALVLLSLGAAFAQDAPPPAPKDAIRNGGFERTLQAPNLWSGVDRDGLLAGFRTALQVLNPSGGVADTPMPPGVAVGDLNGDGLPDILSSDPLGYIRLYLNSGSKEQPKFTTGQLTLPWLGSGEGEPPWRPPGLSGDEIRTWNQRWVKRRLGVRASLADLSGNGKLDIVAGNFFGDIFIVPNTGSAQAPKFAQPPSLAEAVVPTMKDPLHRWGNVFAPLMHDWDGDRKPDLLVGEGSYSANNVHLFLNQGSATSPVFNEDKRQPLALGEGRQQLTPALTDANGDGAPDLLVSDRNGRVTVYLRPDNWKFGDSIPPSGFLAKNGGLTPEAGQAFALGSGISTISTGDMNGDGLFDLVIGRSNGRLAWAPNKGTKDSPKFEAPTDLAGEKPTPPSWKLPSQWDVDTGVSRGNFFAYANSVAAEEDPGASPPEGSRALKFGYFQQPGATAAGPSLRFPASGTFDRAGEREQIDPLFRASAEQRGMGAPSGFFVIRQNLQMEIGKTYDLSFRVKGSKVANAVYRLGWRGYKKTGEDRLIRGERGAVRRERNEIIDTEIRSHDFRPSGNWSDVSKDFKIEFKKERELNKEKLTSEGILEISFELAAPDGFLYLDDVKLVPQG